MSAVIRLYQHSDREAVRRICCDVANRGNPIDAYFPDREIMGDLLTSYYTDVDSTASYVAVKDGEVVGYLTGCLDNRRFGLAFVFMIIPMLICKGLVRGTFFDSKVLATIAVSLKNWRRLFEWRKTSFSSHDGHFHIGIALAHRHQRIGQHLLEAFSAQALTKGITKIAASVHSANGEACRFFEHHGFSRVSMYPMVGIYQGKEEAYFAYQYVKSLA